jgi:arylsulfatase A-like enzyme
MSNTLLVITADHGEEFFEHGGKGHQRSLYDEVVRVPLVVRWPGHLDAGRVVRDQVRLVDLMPTLLSAGGVQKVPPVQGRDVAALLRGESLPEAPALCELLVDKKDVRGLRTNEFKVMDFPKASLTVGFDLVHDPREEKQIHSESARVQAARSELERALASGAEWKQKFGTTALPAEAAEDLRRRITDLGYAGESEPRPK